MSAQPDPPDISHDDVFGRFVNEARPGEDRDFFEVQNLVENALFSRPLPQTDELGSYRLVERIVDRSWGTLWNATHRSLAKRVALWVLEDHRADLDARTRALSSIDDARLVGPSDHGAEEEVTADRLRHFVVEPWVRGLSLDLWRDNRAPTVHETISFWAETSRALAVAHQAGVVHGALGFDSVVVGPRNVPQVVGFGLRPGATTTALAPELTPGESSPRADQYSLARIIRSFYANAAEPDPAESRRIEDVLGRATSAAPEDRWPSMNAFADALARVPTPPSRRRWWVVGAGAGAVVCTAATYAWMSDEAVDPAPCLAGPARHLAEAWTDDSRAKLSDRFAETSAPTAGVTTLAAVDDYLLKWHSAKTEVCQAPDRSQSAIACLTDGARFAAALIEGLGRARPDGMGEGPAIAETLSDPAGCPSAQPPQPEPDELALAGPLAQVYQAQILLKLHETALAEKSALELAAAMSHGTRSHAFAEYQLLVGSIAEANGNLDAASQAYERALWAASHGEFRDIRIRSATALGLLVGVHRLDLEAALAWMRHGDDSRSSGPATPAALRLTGSKAEMQLVHGHFTVAREINDRLLEQIAVMAEARPWMTSTAIERNARLKLAQGFSAEAESAARSAIEVRGGALGDDHPALARPRLVLAEALADQGRFDEARQEAETARVTLNKSSDRIGEASARLALGRVAQASGDGVRAVQQLTEAIEMLGPAESKQQAGRVVQASLLAARGRLMYEDGRLDEAQSALEAARTEMNAARGPHHPDTLRLDAFAGLIRVARDEREEGLGQAGAAFNRAADRWGTYSRTTNEIWRLWVETLIEAGNHDRASVELDVMLEVTNSAGLGNSRSAAWIWQRRAAIARHAGDADAAEVAAHRAQQLLSAP